MRQNNHRQGSSYYPSVDYDAKQSNSNNRQWPRRDRRHAKNNNSGRRIMATTGSSRLLGNNRFRNVTKNGVNQGRGSILDKMDAVSDVVCYIYCTFERHLWNIENITRVILFIILLFRHSEIECCNSRTYFF